MPGWKEDERKVGFDAMPRRLVECGMDSPAKLKEERATWLEKAGLRFVDFLSWRRARGVVKRPPARRKWLSVRERAELDALRERREREGFRW